MRTFGVRALPRVLLLVGTDTDAEETRSETELERVRLLRPFPLRESRVPAMPSEISSPPSLSNRPRGVKMVFLIYFAAEAQPLGFLISLGNVSLPFLLACFALGVLYYCIVYLVYQI